MSQPEARLYRCIYCAGVWRAPDAVAAHEDTCPTRELREAEWRSLRDRFERRTEERLVRAAARAAARSG